MQLPLDAAILIIGIICVLCCAVCLYKQTEIDQLREYIRLHMTDGGRVRVSQEEADKLIMLGKPKQSSTTQLDVKLTLNAADLIAATRAHDYRQSRTS